MIDWSCSAPTINELPEVYNVTARIVIQFDGFRNFCLCVQITEI